MSEEGKGAGTTATVEVVEGESEKRVNPVEMEQKRKQAIRNLCQLNKLDEKFETMWISQGLSVEEVSDELLRVMQERSKSNPKSVSKLGLTEKETKRYSLLAAIRACADNDWSQAGLEAETSREIAKALGKAPNPRRFFVPYEVMQRPLGSADVSAIAARVMSGRRDLAVGTPGDGGYLVGTDNQGFIDLLRNRSVAFRMGATRLGGLRDSVTIPRLSAAGTAYWLANEAVATTESQQTFQQVSMSPKTVAGYTEISRQLMLQSSPGVEGIVTDDLAIILALAADQAAISGSNSGGQPQGIIGAGSVGTVAAGSLNYDSVLEHQVDLAVANVIPVSGGYVTTPGVAKYGMTRTKFSNTETPLWVGNLWDGQMAGFPAMSTNQMPSASMIFGDWRELVIGEWGVLELEVNPYANFQAGIIGIRGMYSIDIGLRRPFAFTVMQTIS